MFLIVLEFFTFLTFVTDSSNEGLDSSGWTSDVWSLTTSMQIVYKHLATGTPEHKRYGQCLRQVCMYVFLIYFWQWIRTATFHFFCIFTKHNEYSMWCIKEAFGKLIKMQVLRLLIRVWECRCVLMFSGDYTLWWRIVPICL